MKNFLLAFIFILLLPFIGYGQRPAILSDYQGRAKLELQKRGLSEAVFKARLLQRGIDLDNIQPNQIATIGEEINDLLEILTLEQRAESTLTASEDSLKVLNLDSTAQIQLDSFIKAAKGALPESAIYGHQIFRNKSIKPIADTSFIRIPDTYILGTGDKITVSIFGASQLDAKFSIDKNGYIQPAKMPKIFLKGLEWAKAKKLLQSRFSQFHIFRSDQFALSLSQPRRITVNIFGEVEQAGSYSLSAVNTAFNALFAANGPTELGTVRNIKIINGTEQRVLDVYEMLDNPTKQFQFYLEDNAIIQVPVAQQIVSISGAVQRPLKYELKDSEGLDALLKYAGGLTATAFQELIQIRRYEKDQPVLIDINWQQLSADNQDYSLQNGDSIIVRSIAKRLTNVVKITGAVELPGKYALTTTQRVSDLLRKGRLTNQAALDVAFLSRVNFDGTTKLIQLNLNNIINQPGGTADILLVAQDKLLINEASRYTNLSSIKVSGAVKDNIEYPFDPDETITIEKAILLAGGLMPEAADYAYLIRTNQNNLKDKAYLRVNIKTVLSDPSGNENKKLQPLDELIILSNSSLTATSTVKTKGAVKFPSVYQYSSTLTLKDVLSLSGGLSQEAANNRIDVFRLVMDNNQPTETKVITLGVDDQFNIIEGPADFKLMPFDEVIVRAVPDFELQALIEITGEVLFPGEYALIEKNESLSDIIRRAGGLSSEAFPEGANVTRDEVVVVTNLNQAISQQNSDADFVLKAGDIIDIPKKDDLVTIMVNNTGALEFYPEKFKENGKMSVPYTPNKSAKWYLEEYAAGFGINAAKTNVTVQYANGAIKRSKKVGLFKAYPKLAKGATIAVGTKPILDKENGTSLKENNNYPKLKRGVIISLDGKKKSDLQLEDKKEENR